MLKLYPLFHAEAEESERRSRALVLLKRLVVLIERELIQVSSANNDLPNR
jgi:hypothetical protein